MKVTLLLAFFLAAAGHADAAAPKFSVLSGRTIAPSAFTPPAVSAAAQVPLSLIVENGSPWTDPGALEALLGKASAIFSPCGLALGPAEVLEVVWTPAALGELASQNPYFGPSQLHVIDEAQLPARRPAAFLFGPSIPATASAYNLKSVNMFAQTGKPEVRKMLNTVWITSHWHSGKAWNPDYPGGDIGRSFSVFAHELAHLFGNLPHIPEAPNLMTDGDGPGAKSGDLNREQCAEIRKLYGL
jgi:hypothetical protein